MKNNTKSSITLPAEELKLILSLMKRVGAKSKVEVVRQGLTLLKETTDRATLRKAYADASRRTREGLREELAELDGLSGDGLPDES